MKKKVLELKEINSEVFLDEECFVLVVDKKVKGFFSSYESLLNELKRVYLLKKISNMEVFQNIKEFLDFIKENQKEFNSLLKGGENV